MIIFFSLTPSFESICSICYHKKVQNQKTDFWFFFLPQLERNEPKNERSASKKSHCQDFGAHHIHFFSSIQINFFRKKTLFCVLSSHCSEYFLFIVTHSLFRELATNNIKRKFKFQSKELQRSVENITDIQSHNLK